jgi:TPR repeat protein
MDYKQLDGRQLSDLAYNYVFGLGVPQDINKSIELYNMAIKKNNSKAMNNLGYMYNYGIGIKQDINKALELYIISIQQDKNKTSLRHIRRIIKERKQFDIDINHYGNSLTTVYNITNSWKIYNEIKYIIHNNNVEWSTSSNSLWFYKDDDVNMTLFLIYHIYL